MEHKTQVDLMVWRLFNKPQPHAAEFLQDCCTLGTKGKLCFIPTHAIGHVIQSTNRPPRE